MFSPNTWAKIETQMIQSRKAAKATRIWKIVQKLFIAIFLLVLNLLLIELITK